MSRIVLLSFADVYEALRELIPVPGVVAAASPHPVAIESPRPVPLTAAAAAELTVATGPGDRVYQPG